MRRNEPRRGAIERTRTNITPKEDLEKLVLELRMVLEGLRKTAYPRELVVADGKGTPARRSMCTTRGTGKPVRRERQPTRRARLLQGRDSPRMAHNCSLCRRGRAEGPTEPSLARKGQVRVAGRT